MDYKANQVISGLQQLQEDIEIWRLKQSKEIEKLIFLCKEIQRELEAKN
jgi:hypothetical protein